MRKQEFVSVLAREILESVNWSGNWSDAGRAAERVAQVLEQAGTLNATMVALDKRSK